MTIVRPTRMLAATLACWISVVAVPSAQQETLANAKEFYASAAYDEALQVLSRLRTDPKSNEATEVAAYQVFCLVALGRSTEARQAAEAMVRLNPLYRPPDTETSPRVRAFLDDVRRPLLPDIARESYAKAKAAFDRKDMPAAATEFDRVLAVIDEVGPSEAEGVSDLKTLATGFRDLAKIAVAAAAPPPPTPKPEAAAAVNEIRVYTTADIDVTRPVGISRTLPPWRPGNPLEQRREYRGVVEVVIDEAGRVIQAEMTQSVNPTYNVLLLEAAKTWTFKPATRGGQPVRFRLGIDIRLAPTAIR